MHSQTGAPSVPNFCVLCQDAHNADILGRSLRTLGSAPSALQGTRMNIASMLGGAQYEKEIEQLNKNFTAKKIRKMFTIQEVERLQKHRKQNIPYYRNHGLSAMLRFLKVKNRQLAIQFAWGRCPQELTTALERTFGEKALQYGETLKPNLSRHTLEPQEDFGTENDWMNHYSSVEQ